jgi:hypothetical protein
MNAQEIAVFVDALEGEVNNGGFHQVFYNYAGDNTVDETIRALATIGATKGADIVKRAAARFPGRTPPKDRSARQDVLIENFPQAAPFATLDQEFYAYPDDLSGLLAKYLGQEDCQ